MRATEFEFRHRFWIISIVFWVAFSLYFIDHVNASVRAVRLIDRITPQLSTTQFSALIRAFFVFGAVLVALGAFVRSWAEAYLHGDVVHDSELHSKELVADGPYRQVRNPLYLGLILMAFGMGLAASGSGFLLVTVAMTVFSYRLILREEAGLLAAQGDGYRAYCAAVPRLWPALGARLPASRVRPRWKEGLTGETFMWVFALAMAAYAITLKLVVFPWLVSAGLAVYVLQNFVLSARQRPRRGKRKST